MGGLTSRQRHHNRPLHARPVLGRITDSPAPHVLQAPSSRIRTRSTGHEEDSMRIYRERIPDVARAVVKALIAEELLEVEAEF
jgi:hypothetical protein